MNLSQTLKHKYHIKYFTLLCLILLYIPLTGIIITQFILTKYSIHFVIAFLVLFAFDVLLIIIYEKCFSLHPINNLEDLKSYLNYFAFCQISDLEYSETITWLSIALHSAYLQKTDVQDEFTNIINKLDLILRPQENVKLCIASKHKKSFIKLSRDLCNSFDNMQLFDTNINTIQNEEPDTYIFIKFG